MAAALMAAAGQAAQAQMSWKFQWKQGQELTYRVEQTTQAIEVTADGKAETKTTMALTKRWKVLAVDASGIATMQHSLTALRRETTTPGGDRLLYDSADPDKSDPQLREQMGKFIGVPLATLRVDQTGKVTEVKESKFGSKSTFEAEPPFLLVLPAAEVKADQTWERRYRITMEPPVGTGEKYNAVQQYRCAKLEGAGAVVSWTTTLQSEPRSLADRMPLLQYLPEGHAVYDLRNGRLHEARLTVEKELKGHAGEGSSYQFRSTYTVRYVNQ
jgi:hypothetical protein